MNPSQTALLPTHSPVHAGASRVSREQGFLRTNPDHLALWREFTFGDHVTVQTPVAERIQVAMRAMEGRDYLERLRFIAAAADAECPGLWDVISNAGCAVIEERDHKHKMEMQEGMERAGGMQSETMRDQFLKQLRKRHEDYVRINPADYLLP